MVNVETTLGSVFPGFYQYNTLLCARPSTMGTEGIGTNGHLDVSLFALDYAPINQLINQSINQNFMFVLSTQD